MKYEIGLDGVRGVAVLAVMLFHFGWLPIGWAGVQLFFVLSGFLITSILLQSRNRPFGNSMARFYWRRALRILPVVLVFMLGLAISYWLTGVPTQFGEEWPWLSAFAANFARLRGEDLSDFTVHMWSLAVEEQFYIAWPFAVLLLTPKRLGTVILLLLALCPLVRAAVFIWMQSAGMTPDYAGRAAYILPLTQFDAFASGAALAVWPRLADHFRTLQLIAIGAALAVAGAASLAWSHYFGGGAYVWSLGYPMYLLPAHGYIWGYSLLNIACLALVAACMSRHAISRLLSTPPLVSLGKISYGVYVFHMPLLAAGKLVIDRGPFDMEAPFSGVAFFVVWAGCVLAVSQLSYRFIESPLLRLKDKLFQ